MRGIVTIIAVAGVAAGASAQIYKTSLDGNGAFEYYNIGANTWTDLNDYFTNSNMAVSQSGVLYAHNATTNMIQRYDPGSDTWTDVLSGPGPVLDKGNLEITRGGEFIYHGGADSNIYYTSGGVWNTVDPGLGGLNALGDYDPVRNVLVFGVFGQNTMHTLDVGSLLVTQSFTDPTGQGNGEWARGLDIDSGSGNVFYHWGGLPPSSFDVDTNGDYAAYTGGFGFYDSLAIDQSTGLVYISQLAGESFGVLDPGSNIFSPLASGANVGNHSSIAWVPAPSSLALLGLGSLAAARRRRA